MLCAVPSSTYYALAISAFLLRTSSFFSGSIGRRTDSNLEATDADGSLSSDADYPQSSQKMNATRTLSYAPGIGGLTCEVRTL